MLRTRRNPETPRDYLQAYFHYAKLISDGQLNDARQLINRFVVQSNGVDQSDETSDGFVQSVETFIRSLGYEPMRSARDPVLGITFSLVDPRTGLFGIGIECDPPKHRLLRKARARELWRPELLKGTYPVLHRISAQAWYHDPGMERDRLQSEIQNAIGKQP